jgi:hypothetical protein
MSKLLVVVAIPLFTGCAYLGARGNDLGDIVRLEGSVGAGLQAHVNAGDLLHAGLGSSRRWTGGWAYGIVTGEKREEDHLPLSLALTLINPDASSLHALTLGEGPDAPRHLCPIVAPASFESGRIRKPDMQFWNIEVGVMALVLGVEAGVNPAEFVDFLGGLVGFDLAGDDSEEGRSRRRLWVAAEPERFKDR